MSGLKATVAPTEVEPTPETKPKVDSSKDGFRRASTQSVPSPAGKTLPQQMGAMLGRVQGAAKWMVLGAFVGTAACTGGPPTTGGPSSASWRAERTLGGVPVTLAPTRLSAAQKLQHYQQLVRAAGNTWREGDMHIIALRGYDLRTGNIHSTQTASNFRDTLVVAGMRNGEPFVQEFVGSTYPGQSTTEGLGQDLNRDGVLDVAMIAEGSYRAVPRTEGNFNGFPAFRLRDGNSTVIPAYRDINQDGIYSAEERAYAVERRATAGLIMLHAGGATADGRNIVASIGCPNAEDMAALIAAVGGPNARYGITLLNAFGEEPYAVHTLPRYQ